MLIFRHCYKTSIINKQSQQNVEGNTAYSTNLIVAPFFFSAMKQDSISKKYVLYVAAHVQLKQTRNIQIVRERNMVTL